MSTLFSLPSCASVVPEVEEGAVLLGLRGAEGVEYFKPDPRLTELETALPVVWSDFSIGQSKDLKCVLPLLSGIDSLDIAVFGDKLGEDGAPESMNLLEVCGSVDRMMICGKSTRKEFHFVIPGESLGLRNGFSRIAVTSIWASNGGVKRRSAVWPLRIVDPYHEQRYSNTPPPHPPRAVTPRRLPHPSP